MARKTEHFDYHVGLGAGVYANSSLGTSGQVLKSDGTNVYWGNDSSSGGDAATLDGYNSTDFVLVTDYSDADVLAKILNVDGPGSTLNADLLDGQEGAYYLPSASYTAADVLSKLLTVDGAGSGVDADLLDGNSSAYFLAASSYTAADVLSKLLTVDGSGSGLDADLWDGNNFASYLNQSVLTYSSPTFAGLTIGSGALSMGGSSIDTYVYFGASGSGTWRLARNGVGTAIEIVSGLIVNLASGATVTGNTIWHAGNDGSGSGLDADLLDGNSSAYFLAASSYTAADVLSKLLTVDGSGSGLDADLWDGNNFATYLNQAVLTSSAPSFAGMTSTARVTISGTAPDQWFVDTDGGTNQTIWRSYAHTNGAFGWSLVNDAVSVENFWLTVVRTAHTAATVNFGSIVTLQHNGNTIWHAGNDGAGSGLDADLLDGQSSAYYATASSLGSYLPLSGGTLTGLLTSNFGASNSIGITVGNSQSIMDISGGDGGYSWIGSRTWGFEHRYGASNASVAMRITSSGVLYQGAGSNLIWHAGNDGAGSGLDADLLDGLSSGAFGQLSAYNTWTNGNLFYDGGLQIRTSGTGGNAGMYFQQFTSGTVRFILGFNDADDSIFFNRFNSSGVYVDTPFAISGSGVLTRTGYTIWDAGNDGAGSGLDADLLDGYNVGTSGSTIGLLSTNHTRSGVTTYTQGNGVNFSNSGPTHGIFNYNNTTLIMAYNTSDWETSVRLSNDLVELYANGSVAGWGGTGFYIGATANPRLYLYNNAGTASTFLIGADSGVAFLGTFTNSQFSIYANSSERLRVPTSGSLLRDGTHTIWDSANDGAGSGLDADLWDGNNFATYLNQAVLTSSSPTFAAITINTDGTYRFGSGSDTPGMSGTAPLLYINGLFSTGIAAKRTGSYAEVGMHSGNRAYLGSYSNYDVDFVHNKVPILEMTSTALTHLSSGGVYWHGGNDGAGSGLDADLLDGYSTGTSGSTIPILNATNRFGQTTYFGGSTGHAAVIADGGNGSGWGSTFQWYTAGALNYVFGNYSAIVGGAYDKDPTIYSATSSTTIYWYNGSKNAFWHAANDGAGSGLDADLLDGYNVGTSGGAIPLMNGTNTWSGTQTMSALTARVTLTTTVSGTLTSAHANISVELNGNVTLPNSVFTAGDKTVFDPGTSARTFTRGSGIAMYVNGTDSASATLAANQIGGAHWRSASVVILTGAFT